MEQMLIIDDDPVFCAQLSIYLKRLGHKVRVASSLRQGMDAVAGYSFSLVFLDVYLPDASGLGGLEQLLAGNGGPEVIVITGKGDPESARQAIIHGAWHYLEKPPDFETIKVTVERVLEHRRSRARLGALSMVKRKGIVGMSQALEKSLEDLARATHVRGNVFINGETGTGKELFARALHASRFEANRPFVVMDCTSIPKTLAEALLFGHAKGAYTDADQEREGFFALAHGGTLFLDEVGDLPLNIQALLLRVLQEKKFRPLGRSQEVYSDFQVVAVTNRDLTAMVESRTFRQDLYFRLAQFRITLPPLRERDGDVALLVEHYLARLCAEQGNPVKHVSEEYLDALEHYHWPGNVRELVSVVAASLANAGLEKVLHPQHLPKEYRAQFVSAAVGRAQLGAPEIPGIPGPLGNVESMDGVGDGGRERTSSPERNEGQAWSHVADMVPAKGNGAPPTLKRFREDAGALLESKYLDQLIQASGGNVAEAMRLADISRTRLYQLLKKHGRAMR